MGAVGTKGREILRKANFDEFREAFIDSIMRKISQEGTIGCNIRPIIEETLKEEEFNILVNKLMKNIIRETHMDKEDSKKAVSLLLEEDVASDIKKNLQGQLQEKEDIKITKKERNIYNKGKETKLWRGINLIRVIGQRPSILKEIIKFLKEHKLVRYTLIIGFCFLVASALLFNSIYKAILVGLTLTAFPGESLRIRIANIIGGFGGVLIFFISITLLFQYLLTIKMQDEEIKSLAKEYLKSKR